MKSRKKSIVMYASMLRCLNPSAHYVPTKKACLVIPKYTEYTIICLQETFQVLRLIAQKLTS